MVLEKVRGEDALGIVNRLVGGVAEKQDHGFVGDFGDESQGRDRPQKGRGGREQQDVQVDGEHELVKDRGEGEQVVFQGAACGLVHVCQEVVQLGVLRVVVQVEVGGLVVVRWIQGRSQGLVDRGQRRVVERLGRFQRQRFLVKHHDRRNQVGD